MDLLLDGLDQHHGAALDVPIAPCGDRGVLAVYHLEAISRPGSDQRLNWHQSHTATIFLMSLIERERPSIVPV